MLIRSDSLGMVVVVLRLHWRWRISWRNWIVGPRCWCIYSIWAWRIVLEWIWLPTWLVLIDDTWHWSSMHWSSMHSRMHSLVVFIRALLAEQSSLWLLFALRGAYLLITTLFLVIFRLFFLLKEWRLWLWRLAIWWINTAATTSWSDALQGQMLPWRAIDEENLLRWVVGNVKELRSTQQRDFGLVH